MVIVLLIAIIGCFSIAWFLWDAPADGHWFIIPDCEIWLNEVVGKEFNVQRKHNFWHCIETGRGEYRPTDYTRVVDKNGVEVKKTSWIT